MRPAKGIAKLKPKLKRGMETVFIENNYLSVSCDKNHTEGLTALISSIAYDFYFPSICCSLIARIF